MRGLCINCDHQDVLHACDIGRMNQATLLPWQLSADMSGKEVLSWKLLPRPLSKLNLLIVITDMSHVDPWAHMAYTLLHPLQCIVIRQVTPEAIRAKLDIFLANLAAGEITICVAGSRRLFSTVVGVVGDSGPPVVALPQSEPSLELLDARGILLRAAGVKRPCSELIDLWKMRMASIDEKGNEIVGEDFFVSSKVSWLFPEPLPQAELHIDGNVVGHMKSVDRLKLAISEEKLIVVATMNGAGSSQETLGTDNRVVLLFNGEDVIRVMKNIMIDGDIYDVAKSMAVTDPTAENAASFKIRVFEHRLKLALDNTLHVDMNNWKLKVTMEFKATHDVVLKLGSEAKPLQRSISVFDYLGLPKMNLA